MPARSFRSHAAPPSPSGEVPLSASPDASGERRRAKSAKRKRRGHDRDGSPSGRRSVDAPQDSEDALSDDVYDPDQPAQERRLVQRSYRDLLRDVTENSEAYLSKDSHGLRDTIRKADALSKKLRQTTEATIDSRLLVSTTDLSYRKTLRLTQGSLAQGLDVDEFVSKCITYMRSGRGIADDEAPELSSTQRQRRRGGLRRRSDGDDDEEAGDDGDMMNWQHLGRYACLPNLRRPALPGFLLGPLSVEKKARKVTKRGARFHPNDLTETRPEVLDVEELAKKEDDLTSTCGKILQRLEKVQRDTQQKVVEVLEATQGGMDDEGESAKVMHRLGLRSTGGVDLMRFVVNPKSFAQTVENLFYVSFLVRDGRLAVEIDEQGLPSVAPVQREADEEGEETHPHGASKHQAVWSMDMKTWREIIDVFGVTEPMIEHRNESTGEGPGAQSWYS